MATAKFKKGIVFVFALFIIFSYTFYGKGGVVFADGKVYLGGMTAGFSLDTYGVSVVGYNEVINNDGSFSPAKKAGVEIGDRIISIDGYEINCANDIENAINNKDKVLLLLDKSGITVSLTVSPVKDINGTERLGVMVKSDITGIGTITYITKNNRFGALGHHVSVRGAVPDKIKGGTIYICPITGVNKGVRGKAGELKGNLLYDFPIGTVDKNLSTGVYGEINSNFGVKNLTEIEVAKKEEYKIGRAYIYSTISGKEVVSYAIEIVKVDKYATNNRDFVIKVSDERLVNETGGIVQGMSGSPIVQDGKLIGAITHVFINDPTRGFGIGIDRMIYN